MGGVIVLLTKGMGERLTYGNSGSLSCCLGEASGRLVLRR